MQTQPEPTVNAAPFASVTFREEPSASPLRVSYLLLLVFLFLLFANLPFILPSVEVLRPAKIVAGAALFALGCETVFGRWSFDLAFPEGGFLILFLGAAMLSTITALWPNYAVSAVSDLAKMILVYFFLANTARTEEKLRGAMWVVVIGGLFPALGTLRNFLTGNIEEGRAAWLGIFANPNEVAYSLVVLLPLAAYLASVSGWLLRGVVSAICLAYLAAIFVTFSRGGLIGLSVVIGFYAWRSRSLWLRGALCLMVLAGILLMGRYWSRGEKFTDLNRDTTVQQRIATFIAGANMFMDHPVTGVGLNCSVVAWPLYAPYSVAARGPLITHNTVIQVMSETGMLGLVSFGLFLGSGILFARRLALAPETARLGNGIEGSLWGFLACGMSGGFILTWFPYILLGLAAAARRLGKEAA